MRRAVWAPLRQQRQADGEHGSAVRPVGGLDLAALGLDEPRAMARPRPTPCVRARRLGAVEPVEHEGRSTGSMPGPLSLTVRRTAQAPRRSGEAAAAVVGLVRRGRRASPTATSTCRPPA